MLKRAILGVATMLAQTATFHDLPKEGLTFDQTKPLSARLTNNTGFPVLGFEVRWIFEGAAAQGNPHGFNRGYINYDELQRPIIAAKSSFAISADDLPANFTLPSNATVEISCAIFADGRVVGTHPESLRRELESKWRAERDVFRRAADLIRNEGASAAVAYERDKLLNIEKVEPLAYRIYLRVLVDQIVRVFDEHESENDVVKFVLARESSLPTVELH